MNDTLVINVDVDGVLYDFTEAMRIEVNAVMGIPVLDLPDPTTWELDGSWPVSHAQVTSLMLDGIVQGRVFRKGWVIDAIAKPIMHRWIQSGHHVRLVTAKTFPTDPLATKMARTGMIEWLYENEIPHSTISFTDHHGKLDHRADVIIDDKPDLSWAQLGADNLLFDHPWNRRVDEEAMDILGVTRVRSWSDIRDRVG